MLALVGLGLAGQFWSALVLIMVWALLASAGMPLRQAYVNGLIPSQQRATILSFDSLMASTGGVVTQPALGRVADVWGYPASFLVSSALSACALPFLVKARNGCAAADARVSRAGGGAGRARRRARRAVARTSRRRRAAPGHRERSGTRPVIGGEHGDFPEPPMGTPLAPVPPVLLVPLFPGVPVPPHGAAHA